MDDYSYDLDWFEVMFIVERLTVANDNTGVPMSEEKQAYDEVARILYE